MHQSSNGYMRQGSSYEHRAIYERHYGEIPLGYIVHHKNGNKSDNRIENLELMTHEEHTRHHAGYLKIGGEWFKKCHDCGKLLPLSEYYKCNGTVRSYCKKCFHNYEKRKEA